MKISKEKFYVKEGHQEQFQKDLIIARSYFKMKPTSSVMLNLIMDQKMHRQLVPGVKRLRLRKKKVMELLKESAQEPIRIVFRHFEGFDEEGYRNTEDFK